MAPQMSHTHAREKEKKQQSVGLHLKTHTMNLAYILRLLPTYRR
jgi:hypothetical protein